MTKLLLSGYYGFDNSGDDAILEAMLKDLKKNKDYDIAVFSNHPKKTEKTYGVRAVDRFYLKKVLGAIKDCDLFISGGGSLLQDVTSTRSLYYYLGLIALAQHYKKKVYVYANGIGPIKSKFNRRLTAKILNKVDRISLRDQMSYDFVQSIGVDKPKIQVTADPVYALDPLEGEKRQTLFRDLGINEEKKYLGLALRDWPQAPDLDQKFKDLIVGLRNKGYDLLFLPLHYPEDLTYVQDLTKDLNPEGLKIVDQSLTVSEMLTCVDALKAFIPMRLHGLIYGVTQAIPMVALSYDPKVEGLAKDLEMAHCYSVEDFQVAEVIQGVEDVFDNPDERAYLLGEKERLQALAKKNLEILQDLVEE